MTAGPNRALAPIDRLTAGRVRTHVNICRAAGNRSIALFRHQMRAAGARTRDASVDTKSTSIGGGAPKQFGTQPTDSQK
jgi:hypothetical protein